MSRYMLRQPLSPIRHVQGGSIRNQLVALNILTLAVLLGGLGFVVRYTVRSFLLTSVDRELETRVQRLIHPPPPGGPRGPGGPHGGPGGPYGGPRGGGPGEPGGLYEPPGSPGGDPFGGSGAPRGGQQTGPGGEPRGGPRGDPFHGPLNGFPSRPENGFPPGATPGIPRPDKYIQGGDDQGRGNPYTQHPTPNTQHLMGMGPPPEEDQRYRPQRFDLNGTSLAPPGRRHALWDPRAFALAKVRRSEVSSTVVVNDEPYQILSAPFPDRGLLEGVVQAPYPLADVNLAIAGLNRALLMLIPVGLLFAGLGGAFLTDRVLGRVNRVRQAAEQIGAQEFSQRLPVIGNDEFSRLAVTFNGLLGRLETSFEAQQRLLEQQRRFTADASHELKTPLTIIKGNTSMALSGKPAENVYRESMQEIDQAADTMSHLVQDLLLLARSDGGQLGRNRIELLVRELLETSISRVARPDSAPVRLNVEQESLAVVGNETELVRLFTNLLDNAVRYTPPSGQITVTARTDGANVIVTVTDTGCGIAPEHLPHLGERFYRADSSRSRPGGGTGLGLSICKGLVEAHGGSIAYQSATGAGMTVTVTLPTDG